MTVIALDAAQVPFGAAPSCMCEDFLLSHGFFPAAGIDEAGRGALAGPVVACAVMLPNYSASLQADLYGVNDSKQLTARQREKLAVCIKHIALSYAVGVVNSDIIDTINILEAAKLAMTQAVAALNPSPAALIIDAVTLPSATVPQVPLIKGDQRSLSVACASIIAKVTRDALMNQLDESYPGYAFTRNKGYGVPRHMQALQTIGVSPIHRKTFAPVRALLEPNQQLCFGLTEQHSDK